MSTKANGGYDSNVNYYGHVIHCVIRPSIVRLSDMLSQLRVWNYAK
jgi:hypothetical protein